ncbi:MAG: hypothetical protein J5I47_00620 [Vicingus serpentipes]|nr:hypothetical protein [Vicingus serpentipes]
MNKIVLLSLLSLLILTPNLWAQEEDYEDWSKDETKKSLFFGGINVGGFFANKNTAIIYTGNPSATPYGISYILSIPSYKTIFDTYFQHPYAISEFPQNPSYSTALDIGVHAGMNIGDAAAIYIDINTSQLKYEQTFTMAIDDPLNKSPEPTYEQIPILGEEKRFNLNLGTQLNFYTAESSLAYFALFGNFNSTKMERNYIVINNREYNIIHNAAQQPSDNPGGIGYGAGTGLGFKYNLTENLLLDLNYNLYYTKINMNSNLNPFGMHHGIMLRVIWN